MPRYRTQSGVVVNLPEGAAARIGGLTPVEAVPPAPEPAPRRGGRKKREPSPTSES